MGEISFKDILIIGPSSRRKGGIASVIKMYKEHINAHYFASTKFQRTYLSFLFFPERIMALIWILLFNRNLKIVHVHGSSRGSFVRKYIIYLVCRVFKKKVIYHVHSGRFEKFYQSSNRIVKRRIKHLLDTSDGIIVLSRGLKTFLEKEFYPNKIFILGNMISEPVDSGKKLYYTGKIMNFTYLGKIFEPKGVYDLLDCIVENYENLKKHANFTFAGNGDEDKTIKYKTKDPNNIIKFTGWLNERNKNNLLRKTDVLVLPSYSEGLPVSVLEAMSYRSGVIVTNVGGIPEIVIENFNGKIITPGSKEELYEAIRYYLDNPDKIIDHAEKGYNVAKEFYPKAITIELQRIYNSVL